MTENEEKNEIIEANYAWNIQEYPGGVRHEVRPIRMRYLSSDFRAAGRAVFRGVYGLPGSTLVSFPVISLWNVLELRDRLSQTFRTKQL